MTRGARFSLAAPRGHALAEAVRLAFETRGADLALVPVQGEGLSLSEGRLRLTLRRGAETPVTLHDPLAMLELSEDLHPGQPLHPRDALRRAGHRQSMGRLPEIARLLDRLIQSTDPRDVDLNTHLLHGQIGQLALVLSRPEAAEPAFSLLDLAAVPLLWRADALDRSFETHLLTGHDALRDLQDRLTRHPQLAAAFDPDLLAGWLEAVAARGGLITRPEARTDWSAALAPAGRSAAKENGFLPEARRTKVHSIGSPGRIR